MAGRTQPKVANSSTHHCTKDKREIKTDAEGKKHSYHLLGFFDLEGVGVNPTEKESDLLGVLRKGVVLSVSDTLQLSLNRVEKPNAPSSSLILGEDRLTPLLLRLISLCVRCLVHRWLTLGR